MCRILSRQQTKSTKTKVGNSTVRSGDSVNWQKLLSMIPSLPIPSKEEAKIRISSTNYIPCFQFCAVNIRKHCRRVDKAQEQVLLNYL